VGKVNESKVDYWLTDDGLILVEAWARDGYLLDDIAQRMGIERQTLYTWRKKYPEIARALNTGKELIDYKVENALLKAALGYTTKEIKVTLGKKMLNGEVYEVLKETTTREIAPNVTACMAWLNNRKHDQWKRNRDKVLEMDEEDSNINITIVRGNPKQDNLGDNVNQEVKFEPKKEEQVEVNSADENDPDYWPDDWEDEDEDN
jgi:transposase-like protein